MVRHSRPNPDNRNHLGISERENLIQKFDYKGIGRSGKVMGRRSDPQRSESSHTPRLEPMSLQLLLWWEVAEFLDQGWDLHWESCSPCCQRP